MSTKNGKARIAKIKRRKAKRREAHIQGLYDVRDDDGAYRGSHLVFDSFTRPSGNVWQTEDYGIAYSQHRWEAEFDEESPILEEKE